MWKFRALTVSYEAEVLDHIIDGGRRALYGLGRVGDMLDSLLARL